MLAGSKVERDDAASRYLLPPVEDFATERLLDTPLRPEWLMWSAAGFTVAAAICFVRGWLGAGLGLLLVAAPLDLIAARLASIRLRPLAARSLAKRALWPLAGLALLVGFAITETPAIPSTAAATSTVTRRVETLRTTTRRTVFQPGPSAAPKPTAAGSAITSAALAAGVSTTPDPWAALGLSGVGAAVPKLVSAIASSAP